MILMSPELVVWLMMKLRHCFAAIATLHAIDIRHAATMESGYDISYDAAANISYAATSAILLHFRGAATHIRHTLPCAIHYVLLLYAAYALRQSRRPYYDAPLLLRHCRRFTSYSLLPAAAAAIRHITVITPIERRQ